MKVYWLACYISWKRKCLMFKFCPCFDIFQKYQLLFSGMLPTLVNTEPVGIFLGKIPPFRDANCLFSTQMLQSNGLQPFCNRGQVSARPFHRDPGILCVGCAFMGRIDKSHAQKVSVVTTSIYFVISRPGTNWSGLGNTALIRRKSCWCEDHLFLFAWTAKWSCYCRFACN